MQGVVQVNVQGARAAVAVSNIIISPWVKHVMNNLFIRLAAGLSCG